MKREWWHGKVAYQIYPKSFQDSNGDGIGDVPGIISRLDYLKSLGVDIIWISPIYQSPCVDQGYDISDYYALDPIFGDMDDFKRLLEETKKRDMHVVMDLVVNHCSDQHPLFQKALADPYGPESKFFYFMEGKPDGTAPCNWRSYFGGSVWDKVPGTENLWYLHLFTKEQPDLNWENPELRERVYKMMNWWLDLGLAGFRIDAIVNIKKESNFKDYPADRADGLCTIDYELSEAAGVGEFFADMRDHTYGPRHAFAVAEAFNIKEGELPDYVGDNGYFSSIFDFSTEIMQHTAGGWHTTPKFSATQYRDAWYASQAEMADHGFYCNIIENHDEPRGASRYLPLEGQTDAGKKMLAVTMYMRRGMPFLYQGQEIGMVNQTFTSIDQVDDVNTIDSYQVALQDGLSEKEALQVISDRSRDNARTPMQWTDGKNAGFTEGTPWLGLNENYKEINVAAQDADPDSVLNFYRALSRLRKDARFAETVVYGDFAPILQEKDALFAFYRDRQDPAPEGECASLLVLANAQNKPCSFGIDRDGYDEVVLNNLKEFAKDGRQITLQPWQAVILC